MGICKGLKSAKTQENVGISLKAFIDSLRTISDLLKKDEFRNYVMELLIVGIPNNNPENQVLCLQCILEISRIFYSAFGTYMEKIVEVSIQCLKSQSEDVITMTAELWANFSDQELAMKKNFLRTNPGQRFSGLIIRYKDHIVPRLMLNLLHVDTNAFEMGEEEVKSLFASSFRALTKLNSLLMSELEAMNMEFIQSKA